MECGQILKNLRQERWNIRDENGKRITYEGKRATKENIALLADMTIKSLTEIEEGITVLPSFIKVEAIIAALSKFKEVNFFDRQMVLNCYGYQVRNLVPSETEVKQASEIWKYDYQNIWYPAYLVDIIHHICAWNDNATKLLGLSKSDLFRDEFANIDILDVIFKIAPKYLEIQNQNDFLVGLFRTMKSEYLPYLGEAWCYNWLKSAFQRYPQFEKYWRFAEIGEITDVHLSYQPPIEIKIRSTGKQLKFQVVAVGFVNDPRFRIAQWIPIDENTTLECIRWKNEELT